MYPDMLGLDIFRVGKEGRDGREGLEGWEGGGKKRGSDGIRTRNSAADLALYINMTISNFYTAVHYDVHFDNYNYYMKLYSQSPYHRC